MEALCPRVKLGKLSPTFFSRRKIRTARAVSGQTAIQSTGVRGQLMAADRHAHSDSGRPSAGVHTFVGRHRGYEGI